MAFVQRINAGHDDKDPYCETIGLVTLEDVIEELIQSEIVDETDVWVDNRTKKRITNKEKQDFSKFVEIRNCQKTICISPQLALATFQFLSTGNGSSTCTYTYTYLRCVQKNKYNYDFPNPFSCGTLQTYFRE